MFIENFLVRSMTHVFVLRAPSRGVLEEIKCPKLPNSYTLITAKDIPGINALDDFPVPILASDLISYSGEAVGLLAGPDRIKLEEYASLCVFKIAPLSPDGAVPTSDEAAVSPAGETPSFLKLEYHSDESNAALSPLELIVSGSYSTAIQEHWYSESHGAAALYAAEKMTIHTATQWPFHVRRSAAKMLAIPDSRIEVIPTELGVHLDGKIVFPSIISCQAALAAYLTGKPAKLMLTRAEDFRYSPKRAASEIHISSALDGKGNILNTEIHTSVDLGSQEIFAREILNQTCLGSLGMYGLGQINIEGVALKTEKPPQGPMEGFGISQGFFASERHVSRIADSLRQDPAEWRKQNHLAKNSSLAIGIQLKDDMPIEPLIDSAAGMSDYYRKWAAYELLRQNRGKPSELAEYEVKRGIGIAVAYQGSGFLYPVSDRGAYGVELTLGKDGSLVIKTSILPGSRENIQIWQSLAKSILAVEEEQITIVNTGGPDSGPDCLSRNITAVTRLIERSCEAIRKQRFRDPLPITVRRTVRPEKLVPWKGLNGSQTADPQAFSRPAWGAAVAEIEIDNVSFEPKVRGIWLVAEGGKILSQPRARRSLKLAAINALSWASREQVVYENGTIPHDILRNYAVPSLEEIPPVYIDFLWNNNANPKGISELPYSCIPAAYVQAVSQAMDYPFEKIPLRAEEIWEMINNKKAEPAA